MRRKSAGSKVQQEPYGFKQLMQDIAFFAVIGAVAIFGIHKWNAMATRPGNLPRIPTGWFANRIPPAWRPWIAPGHKVKNPPPAPAPATPAPATPFPASPATPAPAATPSPLPATPTPAPAATPQSTPMPAEANAVAPSPEPEIRLPNAAITTLIAHVTPSANPLQASASAMYRRGSALYLGLPDGGVALVPEPGKAGKVVRLSQPIGAVKSIAVSGDSATVYWNVEGGAGRVYAFQTKAGTLKAYDLAAETQGGAPPVFDAVATVPSGDGDSVAVLGTGITRFFDPKTGRMRTAAEALSPEIGALVNRPEVSLFVARDAASTAVLVLSGDGVAPGSSVHLTAWTDKGDGWTRHDIDTSAGPAYSRLSFRQFGRRTVNLSTTGVSILTPPVGGQTLSAGMVWSVSWKVDTGGNPLFMQTQPTLADGAGGLWAAPIQVASAGSGLWWTFSGDNNGGSTVIFHAIPGGGRTEAYLPWNGAGSQSVQAILADDTGVWTATDTGVRHIVDGKPSADAGYGGYVRARLGNEASLPPASDRNCQTLAHLAGEWQGTPYKWGGDSRAGIDCSGYVSALYHGVGVNIPRATQELASDSSGGRRIHDDLRFGDILVFPGHCAMYTGNGWTSEARTDAGVAKATIWGRKQVVVRRFLKGA